MAEQKQPTQFSDTPSGWASRLSVEFDAARKALKPFHEQAEKAIKAYLDEEGEEKKTAVKWNIYTADTQTKEAILFGNPPKTSVSRRYADAQDDEARVASEILERLLNADIEGDDDSFTQAVEYAHSDRERVSLGVCRVRYVMGETQEVPGQPAIVDPMTGMERAPAVLPKTLRPNEKAETDYIFWKDMLWSPCRVWHEMYWLAFNTQMIQSEVVKKFGEEVAKAIPYSDDKARADSDDKKLAGPWGRANIWEVWVKDGKQVFYFVEGYDKVITPEEHPGAQENGGISDPLGLEAFWPCPRPMLGGTTTSKLVPKPEREWAKYQYNEIDDCVDRQALLASALRVVGVYDKTNTGLKSMLSGSNLKNEMIPVDNWAMFAEKGGLRGTVEFFPIEQVANVLIALRERVMELLDQARQITGMSDIMRGQASADGPKTATEQRIKARTGSVRMERREKELARFVSDLQRLRGEIIAKHFEESTILARCNCERTTDKDLAPAAVKLIKSDFAKYRIEVKPETLAMTDFDALKQEGIELIGALATYFQAMGPLAMQAPAATPFILEMLQVAIARMKGASAFEGVLDRAVQAAQQAATTPKAEEKPDPKLMTQQMKGQQDLAKIQAETQADLTRIGAEVQADAQREANQMQWNVREHAAKTQISAAMKPPDMGPRNGGQR